MQSLLGDVNRLIGQYCYLSFPQLSAVASHPFTISSAPGLVRGFNDARHEQHEASQMPSTVPQSRMTIHIKALGDFTNRVCDLVAQYESNPQELKVQVKGPYGGSRDGHHTDDDTPQENDSMIGGPMAPSEYPCWILIGGGIGVTPLASILEAILVEHLTRRHGAHEQSGIAGHHWVLLIWTARHQV